MNGKLSRWIPLLLLISSLILFFHYELYRYLTFESLKLHRDYLLNWTQANYLAAVSLYMLLYILAVAVSIPGASFFTLVGGFLFGIWLGTLYVVLAATLGSVGVFLAVRLAFEPVVKRRAGKWVAKMRQGFQEGAVQYLLVLRLVPIFPFWAVNIAAAVLGVSTSVFFITTLIGIIPGSFVYVLLGNGLGHIFERDQLPNMGIIFEPQILLPLIGLALLALLPTFYRLVRKKAHG